MKMRATLRSLNRAVPMAAQTRSDLDLPRDEEARLEAILDYAMGTAKAGSESVHRTKHRVSRRPR